MELTRRKKITWILIALAGVAVLAEVGVRLVCWMKGRVPYTVATSWCIADDELLYVFKPHFEGRVFGAEAKINNQGLRGEDFETIKTVGTWRILCLGDSRTFGYCVKQDECYPARIAALWREKYPGIRLEVLNAGMPGYSSYQGRRYLETRGVRFQPNIVTVAFDFNDRRFVLTPDQADGAARFQRAAAALRRRYRLRFSYALLGGAKVLRHLRGTDTWERDVLDLPLQRLDKLPCRVDLAAFRRNLELIADLCRKKNMAVVFLLLTGSPAVEGTFDEGIRLRSQKRYAGAIQKFATLTGETVDPQTRRWYRALSLYEIGLTREAQGQPAEAQETFRQSAQAAALWSDFGGTPVRHSNGYVEIARAVAANYQARSVDFAATFREKPEFFLDHCHFTPEGHQAIADTLFACLTDNGLLGPERRYEPRLWEPRRRPSEPPSYKGLEQPTEK